MATIEENTIKFVRGLHEEFLPKLEGLEYTEERIKEDGTIERRNPRKATLREKVKLIDVIAIRQAKLQRQIEWLASEQEKHKKNRSET